MRVSLGQEPGPFTRRAERLVREEAASVIDLTMANPGASACVAALDGGRVAVLRAKLVAGEPLDASDEGLLDRVFACAAEVEDGLERSGRSAAFLALGVTVAVAALVLSA